MSTVSKKSSLNGSTSSPSSDPVPCPLYGGKSPIRRAVHTGSFCLRGRTDPASGSRRRSASANAGSGALAKDMEAIGTSNPNDCGTQSLVVTHGKRRTEGLGDQSGPREANPNVTSGMEQSVSQRRAVSCPNRHKGEEWQARGRLQVRTSPLRQQKVSAEYKPKGVACSGRANDQTTKEHVSRGVRYVGPEKAAPSLAGKEYAARGVKANPGAAANGSSANRREGRGFGTDTAILRDNIQTETLVKAVADGRFGPSSLKRLSVHERKIPFGVDDTASSNMTSASKGGVAKGPSTANRRGRTGFQAGSCGLV